MEDCLESGGINILVLTLRLIIHRMICMNLHCTPKVLHYVCPSKEIYKINKHSWKKTINSLNTDGHKALIVFVVTAIVVHVIFPKQIQ